MAASSPARDHIAFLGFLSEEEKLSWYATCNVFALVSDIEGFGVVYLEANAFGKPVVGGNVGGVPEAVVHGETGLLVNIEDSAEIADAIVRLLEDPLEARRLGENGRVRVKEEFQWTASARSLLAVIREALDGKGK